MHVCLRPQHRYAVSTRQSVLINITGQTTSIPAAFSVSILNVNQHPTALLLSASGVAENTLAGVLVAELAAVDPDPGTLFVFSLVGDPSNTSTLPFAVIGTELVVTQPDLLDFETSPWYDACFTSTSSHSLLTLLECAGQHAILPVGSLCPSSAILIFGWLYSCSTGLRSTCLSATLACLR
jgi:hypothetical protein